MRAWMVGFDAQTPVFQGYAAPRSSRAVVRCRPPRSIELRHADVENPVQMSGNLGVTRRVHRREELRRDAPPANDGAMKASHVAIAHRRAGGVEGIEQLVPEETEVIGVHEP